MVFPGGGRGEPLETSCPARSQGLGSWGPRPTPLRASSAGTVQYHRDVPGTTLPVPGGGAGWTQSGHLLPGQSYSGPKGWGLWGEGLLDGLPLSASPLPPAWTKAGIEGQDWHFSQAPRLLRLRLAWQGLGTLTLLWGLPGLPCAIHRDLGGHKEELTGWHQKDGAGFVGLIYLAGGNPVPLSLDPRGCLRGWGVAGSPLARAGRVGGEHHIVGPWPLDRGNIVEVEAGLPWPGH